MFPLLSYSPLWNQEVSWAKLTFAKASGKVTRGNEKTWLRKLYIIYSTQFLLRCLTILVPLATNKRLIYNLMTNWHGLKFRRLLWGSKKELIVGNSGYSWHEWAHKCIKQRKYLYKLYLSVHQHTLGWRPLRFIK